MSILRDRDITCPACGEPMAIKVFDSINADRRPDLRQKALDGSLQQTRCPHCDARFRTEPRFNYLDAGRAQWIAALPAADLPNWRAEEAGATAAFEAAYGRLATPAARAVGEGLNVRLVFGWPALREKIWLAEAGIDDVSAELAKIAILSRGASGAIGGEMGGHLGSGDEMRWSAGGAGMLVLSWYGPDGLPAGGAMQAPRSLIDEIEASPAGWTELRSELTSGPFVDAQRLFVAERYAELVQG